MRGDTKKRNASEVRYKLNDKRLGEKMHQSISLGRSHSQSSGDQSCFDLTKRKGKWLRRRKSGMKHNTYQNRILKVGLEIK